MKKTLKIFVALLVFAAALVMSMPIKAAAATQTTTKAIELETRSALLIDKSGSMEEIAAVEAVVGQYDLTAYDAVVYFDHRISTNADGVGSGDSYICEAIDAAADGGFTHITVVTDGSQWPQKYSALGVYTDLDLTIHLVEEDAESEKFIDQLKGRLVNSSLTVEKPDGSAEVILDDYQEPIYEIEIPVVEDNSSAADTTTDEVDEGDKTFIENIKEGYFPWWLVLLLAALIAALFDFIHELITHDEDYDRTVVKPLPGKAVSHIAKGAGVLADFSGSMAYQQQATADACKRVRKGSASVICFADNVAEFPARKLDKIQAGGGTAGWEALEAAAGKGWKEIVLVSDLGFNGKAFDKSAFNQNFKKITVVAPSNYDASVLDALKTIADEVEVLPL